MFNGISEFIGRSGFKGISGFVGAIGYKIANAASIPLNALFYWPYGSDDSLDEVIEGNDTTFTNATDNIPVFDSNGLVLSSTNSDDATNPVSTSQVDKVVYLGNFTSGNYINGVNTIDSRLQFGLGGKYAVGVGADFTGAILVGSNGVRLQIAYLGSTVCAYVALDGSSDAEIQAGFENTGDSSNLFTIDWSRSAYTLAGVKALRASVGDGSDWVDIPVNDFYREHMVMLPYSVGDDFIFPILLRGDTASDFEILAATSKNSGTEIGFIYSIEVAGNNESVQMGFTNLEVDFSKPFWVRTEKSSTLPQTKIMVSHNGISREATLAASQDITQATYESLQDLNEIYNYTAISSVVGEL